MFQQINWYKWSQPFFTLRSLMISSTFLEIIAFSIVLSSLLPSASRILRKKTQLFTKNITRNTLSMLTFHLKQPHHNRFIRYNLRGSQTTCITRNVSNIVFVNNVYYHLSILYFFKCNSTIHYTKQVVFHQWRTTHYLINANDITATCPDKFEIPRLQSAYHMILSQSMQQLWCNIK